jgi:hypothetical protein
MSDHATRIDIRCAASMPRRTSMWQGFFLFTADNERVLT